MNIGHFKSEYTRFLKSHANPQRAEKEKAYLYSDLKHYGVSVWERRKFVKPYAKELKALSKNDMHTFVADYWERPYFEERSLALDILNLHKESLTPSDMPLIERLMRESRGWAFLDNLIIPIMPVILEKDPRAFDYLRKWIQDRDYWVRRSALLAQVKFFRANEGGDKELFFELARSQFDESWIEKQYLETQQRKRARFFIRKAIGWSLREMSRKDPQSAFRFLKKHKDEMSGLSFRDGSRLLPVDLQKQF